MAKSNRGLSQQNGVFYARKGVPPEARPILGKTEIHKSLATRDEDAALDALPEAMAKLDDLVEVAKVFSNAIGTTDFSEPDLKDLFKLNKDRLKPISRVESDEIDFMISTATAMMDHFAKQKSENKEILPDWKFNKRVEKLQSAAYDQELMVEFEQILEKCGIETLKYQHLYKALFDLYKRSMLLHEITQEKLRQQEVHLNMATNALFINPSDLIQPKAVKPLPEAGILLSELFEKWRLRKKPKPDTLARARFAFRHFVEFVGDKPINHIDKNTIDEFLETLNHIPRNRLSSEDNMTIQEIIKKYENSDYKKLTHTTLKVWFGFYDRIFQYAVDYHFIDKNLFDGTMDILEGEEAVTKRYFQQSEIDTIFNQPAFMGTDKITNHGFRLNEGSVLVKDYKYWIPIILLLHGARISELTKLRRDQFERIDGIDVFNIKRAKNKSSIRCIPAHPLLMKLGWMDYLKSSNDIAMFPEIFSNKDAELPAKEFAHHLRTETKRYARHLNRFIDAVGITDREVSVHSLRHSWKVAARDNDVPEELHDLLTGHASQSVSRGVYKGASLKKLAAEMNKVKFPSLPVARLLATAGKDIVHKVETSE